MKNTTRRSFLASTAALSLLPALPAFAQDATVVQMVNKHPEDSKLRNAFFPRVIAVEPGTTVRFEATDKGHNSAVIKDMHPDGAEGWKGKINQEVEVTFDTPGVYGYQCTPHAATGMVGLVFVKGDGMLDNLESAQAIRQRGKAKAVFADLWEEAAEMGLLEPSA